MYLKQSGKASEELHLENGGGQGCQKEGDGMNISSSSQQVQRPGGKRRCGLSFPHPERCPGESISYCGRQARTVVTLMRA